jgi:hypothetical protein
MSTCWGVKVVQKSRLVPSASRRLVNGAPGPGRGLAPGEVVAELRRVGRDVVDYHVGHDLEIAPERAHRWPVAQPRVDLRMVGRVEARVGAIDRREEGQQVHAAEQAGELVAEHAPQVCQRAAGKPIHVGDQLDLVFHRHPPCMLCCRRRPDTATMHSIAADVKP